MEHRLGIVAAAVAAVDAYHVAECSHHNPHGSHSMLASTSEPQSTHDKGRCGRSGSTNIGGEPDAGSGR